MGNRPTALDKEMEEHAADLRVPRLLQEINVNKLLTPDEHKLVEKLGECFGLYKKISEYDGVSVTNNRDEFAVKILHLCQDQVLARAAARAFPGKYRV